MARLLVGLVVLSGVLVIVLAVQVWAMVESRSGIAAMGRKLQQQSVLDEQMRPVLQEREQIVRNLMAMSSLVESRRFSWTRLLSGMEAAFPTGVALTKLEFNPKEHSLVIDGVAQSPEALRNLMVGLEKSSSFKEPLLKHQSVDKGSISFNVVASYADNKTASMAH